MMSRRFLLNSEHSVVMEVGKAEILLFFPFLQKILGTAQIDLHV